MNVLVGEPASGGQLTTTSVSLSPSGGSATVDLLKLQNVSQTIASTSVPTGSTVYSVGFTVQSVSISINGTVYPVTLAVGGADLGVTLANPTALVANSSVLLELNPVVADTPTGYQMIPSMVGILRLPSEYQQGDNGVGTQQQVGQGDNQELDLAAAQISARLVSLSVSGNTTNLMVQVNNTGDLPVTLVAIGVHGNFTSQGGCPGKMGQDGNGNGNGNDNGKGSRGKGNGDSAHSCGASHNEVVFSPIVPAAAKSSTSSTTTAAGSAVSSSSGATTCSSGNLALASGNGDDEESQGSLVLSPGKCIDLTFSGQITFGQSAPIVPSTQAGQSYTVHVIASNDGEIMLGCTLPLTAAACTVVTGQGHSK